MQDSSESLGLSGTARLPDLLTPSQVAEVLNVGSSTVRAWGRSGALRSTVLPGGQRRYFRDDVEAIARGEVSA